MLKLTKFLILMNCFLSPLWTIGQATLTGIVSNEKTQETLIGATVRSGDIGNVTDFEGRYTIELPAGTYKFEVSFTGYEKQEFEISIAEGETKEQNIFLEEANNVLNTATVTSSKVAKPLGEVTVSLEVIKPSLIENASTSSADEVVEKVPGVNVIDGQANIRGGSGYSYGAGSRVLLLIDDLPYLSGDAGFPSWRDIPVENIEQIEVLKGAASALYGSSALNGIINIRTAYAKSKPVTKLASFYTVYNRPKDEEAAWWDGVATNTTGIGGGAGVDSLSAPSPGEAGIQLAHRQKIDNFDLVLGGNFYNNNSFRQGEHDRKGRFSVNTRYRITDKISVGINSNFNVGRSASYFFWANEKEGKLRPFGGTITPSKVLRFNVDPFLTIFDNAGNSHKILTRYYYVDNRNGNNQANKSKLAYGEYQFHTDIEALDNLSITTGVVGVSTKVDAQLYGNAQFNLFNMAAYLQLDKKLFDCLNLSFGARYERFAVNSPDSIRTILNGFPTKILNPNSKSVEAKPVFRFGANYQPAEYTYIRASWGQGYRYPTVAEKFVVTQIGGILSVVPNPTLESETGWSAELGLKQGFKITDNWLGYFDVSGFWTEYQNMMEFTFGGNDPDAIGLGFQSINIGNTVIKGFDVSVLGQGKIGDVSINTITGYTFIDPKFKDWGTRQDALSSADYNILKYRFRHTFKFDTQADYEGFGLGLSCQYNSFMEAIDDAFQNLPGLGIPIVPGIKEYREAHNKGNTIFDARLSYKINEHAKLAFLVKNIFNIEYAIRPGLLEAPRNYTFRMDYDF